MAYIKGNSLPPLAERLRPKEITEIIGHTDLLGQGGIITRQIRTGNVPSMIFWGQAGIGKTTLALAIAKTLNRSFYVLNATSDGVKSIRDIIKKIDEQNNTLFCDTPIVFIDEIHRFTKSQQDSLLNIVEKGTITLIGATTENPGFEIINPLLSRCNIYVLQPLTNEDLIKIVDNAVKNDIVLSKLDIEITETNALLQIASHDARKLLNILEGTVNIQDKNSKIIINNENVVKAAGHKIAVYDKNGEYHYDIISAFIKSIRGSDPNGAIFWLACMLNGGEDIKFIARRLIILASEDIGNANPMALVVANNCFQAVNSTGMPESGIILAQCTTYLASSGKSNASYMAIKKALTLTKNNANYTVPLHLRNAPTKLMKDLNYGKDYKYSHNYDNNFVDQEYLPEEISGTLFYEPQDNDVENSFRLFLKNRWGKKYNY